MSPSSWSVALAAVATFVAVGLASAEACAEPRPLRVDYEAHEGCPAGSVFLEEVLARTSRARAAAAGEPALDVWVRITRSEPDARPTHAPPKSIGRLVLWKSSGARAREVDSDNCADVVSALALITALALDPNATSSPRAATLPPPPDPPPPDPPPPDPPAPFLIPPAPDPWAMPLQPIPTPWPTPPPPPVPPAPATAEKRSWIVGAHLSAAFAVTPRPLLGGGLFVERRSGSAWGAALRLGLELATTGPFDIGPGGVEFLLGAGRLEGCPFLRAAPWLALAACLTGEVGFLRGEGLRRGTIAAVEQVTVPWVGLGLGPRVAFDVGERAVLGLEGGPIFPLVRRSFVFEQPDYTIYQLPAVTWAVRLDVGVRF